MPPPPLHALPNSIILYLRRCARHRIVALHNIINEHEGIVSEAERRGVKGIAKPADQASALGLDWAWLGRHNTL